MNPHSSQQTVSYVTHMAFRAAYLSTYASMLEMFHDQNRCSSADGFMDQLPLTSGCAPQVQLHQLFKTWVALSEGATDELTDLDHCVCYCVSANLAKIAELNDQQTIKSAAAPNSPELIDGTWMASKLRTMQITWPFPGDSATIVRDRYLAADILDEVPESSTANPAQMAEILELAGQWTVTPEILSNASGVLTEGEIIALGRFFQKHPRLMNL